MKHISLIPKNKSMDLSQSPRTFMRTNAAKNFKYTPPEPSSTIPSTSGTSTPPTRVPDLRHCNHVTSFRINGNDGEIDWIIWSLGLHGPEDFDIPKADYELMKSRISSNVIQQPKRVFVQKQEANEFGEPLSQRLGSNGSTHMVTKLDSDGRDCMQHSIPSFKVHVPGTADKGSGIKGVRPLLLTAQAAQPSMIVLALDDNCCASGDLLERLTLDDDRSHLSDDAETNGLNGITEEGDGVIVNMTGLGSFTTVYENNSSCTIMEPLSVISPTSGSRINITQWEKIGLLGKGSFGTVYKGISSKGFFFAIKEVSLLEQGSQGRQSVCQLEQEIELLSRFEHKNIVRYLGTERDDSNLYIFLELVTQGSLASLYEKCHLRDYHVSKYTRHILMGLKYLHDQNVVHRDIKCANILVTSNGTVKLADFGLAKATKLNDLKSCKGSAFWMAPEVINQTNEGYGLAADIWSLGCTVLEMLTRHVPHFPFESQHAIYMIGQGKPPTIPDYVSTDARDFIQQCLRVNANDRPTAAELLDHQFIQGP